MKKHCTVFLSALLIASLPSIGSTAEEKPAASRGAEKSRPGVEAPEKPARDKPSLDRSGEPRRGKASFYHDKFAGRKMADGTPMNPDANIAASRTLPLGTRAEVVNLENGKSAEVEIRDRGPYVDGRIVDLSPKVARDLEITEQGIAAVEVRPVELPEQTASRGASDAERTGSGN